jgi:hypothetical protein
MADQGKVNIQHTELSPTRFKVLALGHQPCVGLSGTGGLIDAIQVEVGDEFHF